MYLIKNPEFIRHRFFIHYKPNEKSYMYTELKDGRYAKTYHKDNTILSEYITLEEYASALAHVTLRGNNPQ